MQKTEHGMTKTETVSVQKNSRQHRHRRDQGLDRAKEGDQGSGIVRASWRKDLFWSPFASSPGLGARL